MTTEKEKWDAYKEALRANIKAHQGLDPDKEKAKEVLFDQLVEEIIKKETR